MNKVNQVFEGTLVAAGWDKLEHVNKWSLYTQKDEDILLVHGLGMKKFSPYLNHKVRILGDVISNLSEERSVAVKKISKLLHGFTPPIKKNIEDIKFLFKHI